MQIYKIECFFIAFDEKVGTGMEENIV